MIYRIAAIALAGTAILSLPAIAQPPAEVWDFTVVEGNVTSAPMLGLEMPCNSPCEMLSDNLVPYLVGVLSLKHSNGHAEVDYQNTPWIDDQQVISFEPGKDDQSATLSWPCAYPDPRMCIGIAPNINVEVHGDKLSGIIEMWYVQHGTAFLQMRGVNNVWTGSWQYWERPRHDFVARSDRQVPVAAR